jgi:alpha-ribazole phosphatase
MVRMHTVCWLVRHSQTSWNREGRYLSRTDLPLTTFGQQRAEAIAWRLRRLPITVVVHSDLEQTRAMAQAVAARRPTSLSMLEDCRWRDVDHGHWEGLRYRDVVQCYAAEAQARFADPWNVAPEGGETLSAAHSRVVAAWQRLQHEHDGGRIVIISHATPIQLLLCHLMGMEPRRYWQLRVDAGSLSSVDLYPTAAIIRTINELPPLRRGAD